MTPAIFIQRGPARLSTAIVFSVLFHALLLSITLGGQAFGLPGLSLPWKEKRLGADDLRIFLAPAPPPVYAPPPVPAEPSPTKMANAVLAAVDKAVIARSVTPMTMPPDATGRSEAAAVFIPPPIQAPTPTPLPITPAMKLPGRGSKTALLE